MGRITDRLQRVEKQAKQRPTTSNQGRWWQAFKAFLTFGLVFSLCTFTFLLGYQLNGEQVTANTLGYTLSGELPQDPEIEKVYRIDGYTFEFLDPDAESIQGLAGYTYGEGSRDIYIRNGYGPESIYSTCVHEKLHTKGIGENYHDYIYENQDRLVDGTCLKLLFLMNGSSRSVYKGEVVE